MGVMTSLAIAGAGMGLGIAGARSKSKAAKKQAKAERDLANFNAQVSEKEAEAVEEQTTFDQVRQALRADKIIGSMRAKLGTAGAVMSEGAPLLAMAEQAFELDLENMLIGEEGMRQAERHRWDAQGFRMGAQAARAREKAASKAGMFDMANSILGGFGNMYSAGMFGGGSGGGAS